MSNARGIWTKRPNLPTCKGFAKTTYTGEVVPCSAILVRSNGYCWRHQNQAAGPAQDAPSKNMGSDTPA